MQRKKKCFSISSPLKCGYRYGYRKRSSENQLDQEVMYNDELTASKWALNSAVECHLHTFPRSNTFNNLTRLPGTAKYLKVRVSQKEDGGFNGAVPESARPFPPAGICVVQALDDVFRCILDSPKVTCADCR